jgi:hypothetical protein
MDLEVACHVLDLHILSIFSCSLVYILYICDLRKYYNRLYYYGPCLKNSIYSLFLTDVNLWDNKTLQVGPV